MIIFNKNGKVENCHHGIPKNACGADCCMSCPPSCENKEFWKDIIYKKDGSLNEKQILKELADFRFLMKEVPLVYMEIAGLSKLMYSAKVILEEHEQRFFDKGITQDDVFDILEDKVLTAEEKLEEIKKYLEIPEK